MNRLYVALDVGGTYVKAGVIDKQGKILNSSITKYDAKSKQSSEVILSNFVHIIKAEIDKVHLKEFVIDGIGFAFPGPFDYENNICLIKGIDKYESIYGMNIGYEIKKLIERDKFFDNILNKEYKIAFENDAGLFALGECSRGKAKGYRKVICIAIGTGCGSAFLDNCTIVKDRHDVPVGGVLYHLKYGDSIVDDYISARGISQTYKKQNGMEYPSDIKSMADEARQGEARCKKTFDTLGDMLGEVLLPHLDVFAPECIILGGQISKSFDLFSESLYNRIEAYNLPIFVSDDTSASTISGVGDLLNLK